MAPPVAMATGGFTLYYNITLAFTPGWGGLEARLYNNVGLYPRLGGLYYNVGLYQSLNYIVHYSLLFLIVFSCTSLYLGQIWPPVFAIFQAFLGHFSSNYYAIYGRKFPFSRPPFDRVSMEKFVVYRLTHQICQAHMWGEFSYIIA